jgi:hypothetical protein
MVIVNAASRPRSGRWRWIAASAVAGSLGLGASAAQAAVGPQGVRPNHNITVFHNIDMVASFGHQIGQQTKVDVFRGAHHIASARGAAFDAADDGGALEVNHGPVGAPAPGDCWDGATPDIRPGDRIEVTNPGGLAGVDEAIVDDITIASRRTVVRDAATGGPPSTGPTREEVWIEGVARYMDKDGAATPIPTAALDSAGFIDLPNDNQLRLGPNQVDAGPNPGDYIARYYDADPREGFGYNLERNRNNQTDAQILNAIKTSDGHASGYGHVAPLPPVSMLVDGLSEQTTAAPGCEIAPKHDSSVGTMSADGLNVANSAPGAPDLVVGGWAAAGVGSAEVTLSNGAASTSKAVDLSGGTGPQGWSASFTQAELADLGDGTLNAQLTVGGTPVGVAKTIRRDTVAPVPPTMTPGAGTYIGRQAIDLAAADGSQIHYTTDGSEPTRASLRYGAQIVIDRDTTVKAIAVDAAGNASPVVSAGFTISAPAPVGVFAPVRTVPGVGVLGASASPLPSVAPAAVTLKVRRLTLPARMSAGAARRRGVVASFVTPAGAAYAEARLIRLQGAKRRLVGKRLMAATPGRRQVARFTTAAVRKQLAAGRYVIEVRTGPSAGRLGPAVTMRLRVGG